MMEYNELLKHIAALEARCVTMDKVLERIISKNKDKIIAPTDEEISEELKKQIDICKVKYKLF